MYRVTTAIILLGALLIAACAPGLSRDAAAERALAEAGPGAESVASAQVGPLINFVGQVPSDESPDRLVWAVVVRGTFEGECVYDPVTGGSVCPPVQREVLVVLDHATGDFVLSRIGP